MTDLQVGAAKPAIVRVTIEHVAQVTPIFVAYSAFYGRTVAAAAAQQYLHEGVVTGESVIFMALTAEQQEAGGFLQMHPSRSSKWLGRRWIVNDIFVQPTLRRQHIGRRLLAAAQAHAVATTAQD
nr:GNAT family N-acetyltransferase [Ktedonobacterales bacterium]